MMDFEIDVQVQGVAVPEVVVQLVETAVRTTLSQQQIAPPGLMTCLLTTDAAVRRLNRRFRQTDKPTDVLSFPGGDPMPGMPLYLGDIALAIPYARRQAEAAGHSLAEELQLLAIHGTLHLLGHDHDDDAEKATMWAAQTAVLTQLNLQHVKPTEE